MKLYKYKLKQLLCKHEYKYSGMTWNSEGEPRYKHRCTKCKKSIYKLSPPCGAMAFNGLEWTLLKLN